MAPFELLLLKGNIKSLNKKCVALISRACYAEAESCFRKIVAAYPNCVRSWYNLGVALKKQHLYDEALHCFRHAIGISPEYALAYGGIAEILEMNKDTYSTAERCYRMFIRLQPNNLKGYSALAKILYKQYRYQESSDYCMKSLELNPNCSDSYNTLGAIACLTKQYKDAERYLRTSLLLNNNQQYASKNLGGLLLLLGQYEEGWPLHESRDFNLSDVKLTIPQWQGEDLQGKSILVLREQGFGDAIQMARYFQLLKERGSRVVAECKTPMVPLFKQIPCIDDIVTDRKNLKQSNYDYWVMNMSLPHRFQTTLDRIPNKIPYITVKDKWNISCTQFKVGIVWKGNPNHKNDYHRSLSSLQLLAPLWNVKDIHFISLQKGAGEDEIAKFSNDQPLTDWGTQAQDFLDMAKMIQSLDLVICVDTAVAHLSGALGKPCWVLVPFIGTDWRWMNNRSDTPWYPNVMKLFRQPEPGNWDVPIAEIKKELQALVSGKY